jgi:2-polyprenyl-6-methoxyphenol hydroxylase-like FAD-dependent oxidoreductase
VALNAVLLPLEGGRWIVTIADRGSDLRPDTWDSFHAILSRRLITPTIYRALHHAKPLEGIRHYGLRASHWRHFERLPGLPRGVLPIGDALCRFNPIHAQGMSAAAKQARLLQTVLGQMADEPDPLAAAQACHRRPRPAKAAIDAASPSFLDQRFIRDLRESKKPRPHKGFLTTLQLTTGFRDESKKTGAGHPARHRDTYTMRLAMSEVTRP